MISRRLLRTKVLHVLYAHFRNEGNTIQQTEKELRYSIDKAYDLYHYLLSLIVEVADFSKDRIDIARNKRRPTPADLNPNLRFVDNPVIEIIRNNRALTNYLTRTKLSWKNDGDLVKTIFGKIQESAEFKEYMEAETSDFDADKRILVKLFNKEIMSCEDLYDTLEEQSIYWNDDVEYVINMIAKTIKRITPEDSSHLPLMPLYRDEEDEEFASKLLRKSLTTSDELDGLITEHAENWELDRIIFIDRLLLRLAMTEMMEFSQIPTKVTINEYLEISKYYSSQKSNVFINGVLEQMLVRFRKEGRINKQGRGLIGEGEE